MRRRFSLARLAIRSATYYLRSSVLAALVSAAAAAVVVGALLAGDSMRGSLAARVEERLGGIDCVVLSKTFLRAVLARELTGAGDVEKASAVLILRGALNHPDSGRTAADVKAVGVSADFWSLWPERAELGRDLASALRGRRAAIGRVLADELGAREGDEIVLRFERAGDVPSEYALGRRGERALGLRLEVVRVLPDAGPAIFDIEHSQRTPKNIFLPIDVLERSLQRGVAARRGSSELGGPGFANCLLLDLVGKPGKEEALKLAAAALGGRLRLEDFGLRLRREPSLGYLSLESREILLPPWVERAVEKTLEWPGAPTIERLPVATYLANSIRFGGREIPYSTVSALGSWRGPSGSIPAFSEEALRPGEILLNAWAAEDLGARPGDRVTLSYYAVEASEELVEREAEFTVRGIVPLEGLASDPGWTPEYPGISEARSVREWDPPVPVNLSKIRPKDEEYWSLYRATPKAFISVEDARRLWSSRFGLLTSLRFRGGGAGPLEELARELETRLPDSADISEAGLRVLAVRAEGLEAASGATDFGALFLGLSCFLIGSTLILLAMIVRLGCERRSRETGILAAVGFSPLSVTRTYLIEGFFAALVGTVVGVGGGLGYAALLVAGLRSIWSQAVNAPFLNLHARPQSLLAGGAATAFLSLATIAFVSARSARVSPRELLARSGSLAFGGRARGAARRARALGLGGLVFAAASLAAGTLGAGISLPATFFFGGAALLVSLLSLVSAALLGPRRRVAKGRGRGALVSLGIGYSKRNPIRSLSTVALVASAAFLIGSASANRLEPGGAVPEKASGDGGFALAARSSLPLTVSLRGKEGRDALGIQPDAGALLDAAAVFAFRVQEGDDASCRNLYRPLRPRLLGARTDFILRGGFAWAGSLAHTEEERRNPWLLLLRTTEDGAIPAIADASSAQWSLRVRLGEDFAVRDAAGKERPLRLVGTLSGSVFQGAIVIAESRLLELFPDLVGDRFFLFEVPPTSASELASKLERDLSDFGFDVETTASLLMEYRAVANTYLSAFELLGWMGLLLGTLGLGAVLARNVHERRGELALLSALGYSPADIGWIVLSETAFVLCLGLAVGGGASLVSLLPVAGLAGGRVSVWAMAASLGAIGAAGLVASIAALIFALRTPLIPALRAE